MEAIDTCYISAACNRTCLAADWGQNNLICFGSANAVCIYSPEGGKTSPCEITATLPGHTDRVNCVRWIKDLRNSYETEFVSGSVDKCVIVWKREAHKFVKKACLTGHTLSVNSVTGVYVVKDSNCSKSNDENCDTYIASASTDSTVKIWRRLCNKDFEEVQTLSYGSGLVLDLVFTVIPNTKVPLLACGVDDQKIHIYTLQNDKFVKSIVLTGHEDWVRGLDFTVDNNGDLLLASCAQDNLIRLWRFSRREGHSSQSLKSIKDLAITEDIKMRENTFSFDIAVGKPGFFAVSLESVLSGHDNWIFSVKWQKPIKKDGNSDYEQGMCLLSASMDKTMIVWKPDPEAHVWVEQVRVGEVGGNTLGFYGGMFGPDGQSIMAHGYQGAFHHWSYNSATQQWDPTVTGGGHFSVVEDIDWDRGGGQFLLSTSLDQTTRLHAPWVVDGRPLKWYEIGRPQVHGYDIQCLTMINRYQFASGADEKVVRVFNAPKNFMENFCRLCGENLENELNKKETESLPEGASVPALGLSNKAVFTTEKETDSIIADAKWNEQYPEVYFNPLSLTEPPSEENLLQNTLWPETQKLYGHGYEIFAIACNPAGTILATACKASKAEYANILLWDTSTWKQICSLEGSTLTVTQLAFSHAGQYLLAVSRDRSWSLYTIQHIGGGDGSFERVAYVDKKSTAHSRIIWACSWSNDDQYFITASRDKKIMMWNVKDVSLKDTPPKPCSIEELQDSVTAVDIAPTCFTDTNKYLVSVGLECGHIILYTWNSVQSETSWTKCAVLDQTIGHHLTVKRLKFRPCLGIAPTKTDETKENNTSILQLASCSADHSVKIFNIHLDKL